MDNGHVTVSTNIWLGHLPKEKEHLQTRQLSVRYENLSLGNTLWEGHVD